MKAIPLIACLALVAVQVRAQNGAPADAAVPAHAAPAPPSLAERARLLNDIKSFRHEQQPLPPEFEPKLNDLEQDAGAANDLDKTEKDFQSLKDELLAKKPATGAAARVVPNGGSSGAPRIQAISDAAGRYSGAARNDGQFYDGARQSGLVTAPPDGAAASLNANGPSSGVNAPASTPNLRTNPVPSPDEAPAPPTLTPESLPAWVFRNGVTDHDFESLKNLAPLPPAPPPAEKPRMPSSDKPSSLAALAAWIDGSGISQEVLDALKKIEVLGSELLSGFGGYCYWGVKWMLTLVLPGFKEPKDLDLPEGDAYKMLLALKKDPKMMEKLHLMPLDLKSVPRDQADTLPERTLLIWDRGCAGFSDKSGHIEFTLHADKMSQLQAKAFYPLSRKYGFWVPNLDAKTQVLACSDGCEVHYMSKLRAYAGKCLSVYVPVVDPPAAGS